MFEMFEEYSSYNNSNLCPELNVKGHSDGA